MFWKYGFEVLFLWLHGTGSGYFWSQINQFKNGSSTRVRIRWTVHGDKKVEGQFVNFGLWISKKLRLDSVWLCISTKPYSYPPYWIFLHVQKLKYFRTISNTAISSSFQIQNVYWIFKYIRIKFIFLKSRKASLVLLCHRKFRRNSVIIRIK